MQTAGFHYIVDKPPAEAGGVPPPPLTPPRKGEGELPHAKSPSPLWGGVRGGGIIKFAAKALLLTETTLGIICGALLALLLVVVLVSVVLRYGFGAGLLGSDELAIWLHVALIGLGAPLALNGSLAMRFDALVSRLPLWAEEPATVVASAITLLAGLLLASGGLHVMTMLGGVSTSLAVPEWLRFVGPCIGGGLIVLVSALRHIATGQTGRLLFAALLSAGLFLVASQVQLPVAMSPSAIAGLIALIGLLVGAPLAHTLLVAALLVIPFGGPLTEPALVSTVIAGVSKFLLLAIPFFLLAGDLFAISGLVDRLVRLAASLVGHRRGGVAQTALLTSVLFSGASGSSVANAAFGAKTFAPALIREGYSPPKAGAIIAATSVLDNVIPPSIAFLILAAATELSVGRLLVGGFFAGLVMAVALAISIRMTAVPMAPGIRPAPTSERWRAAKSATPALGLGLVILVGIRLGVVTPTEAAAVACLYTLVACFVFGRGKPDKAILQDLPPPLTPPHKGEGELPHAKSPSPLWGGVRGGGISSPNYMSILAAFKDAAIGSAAVGLLIGSAAPFAFLLAVDDIGSSIASLSRWVGDSPLAVLLFANFVLLAAGMVLDIGAAILLLAPILLPLAIQSGLDPVHFGVILVVNLMIGGLTPPVGMLVYVVAGTMRVSSAAIFRAVLPHVAALLGALAAISAAAWFFIPS